MGKSKIFLLVIVLNALPQFSFSQLVHLELGGAGFAYSVNIDFRFLEKRTLDSASD